MEALKIKAAGINKDTLETAAKMKADLLETSFQVSFQKELDAYKAANVRSFPRHKINAAMLDREKQTKDGNKAHDAKINWGLRQVSQVSQKEERSPVRINTGSVIGDYNAR